MLPLYKTEKLSKLSEVLLNPTTYWVVISKYLVWFFLLCYRFILPARILFRLIAIWVIHQHKTRTHRFMHVYCHFAISKLNWKQTGYCYLENMTSWIQWFFFPFLFLSNLLSFCFTNTIANTDILQSLINSRCSQHFKFSDGWSFFLQLDL